MNGLSLYLQSKHSIQKFLSVLILALVIAPQAVFASAITPQAIIELTNAERVKHEQSVLTINTDLTVAAYTKAQNMIDNGYFDHFGPHGETPWQYIVDAGYDYHFAGENLAMDFEQSEKVVEAWMNSATHRDNILDSHFEAIGVAVTDGVVEGHETTLIVQMFGSPQPTLAESLTPKIRLTEYIGVLLGINEHEG